jgi:hypothetical protein
MEHAMRRRRALGLLAGGLLGGCSAMQGSARPGEEQAYLFSYFLGNGADGLHFAASRDGYQWDALRGGASFLAPTVGKTRLMRDPCIARGPDGIFHMVWTSGWNDTGIGYASSPDLVQWSPQRGLPVMAHEPQALNAWAPEIIHDAARGQFLILWASTIPGRFPQTEAEGDAAGDKKYNHRIYATTTKDFVSFTPTTLFYEPGFSVIDATFVQALGRDWLVVKDETRYPPKKYLQVAAADSLQGPFGPLGDHAAGTVGRGAKRLAGGRRGDPVFRRLHRRALRRAAFARHASVGRRQRAHALSAEDAARDRVRGAGQPGREAQGAGALSTKAARARSPRRISRGRPGTSGRCRSART